MSALGTILLAEDDPNDAGLLLHALRDVGFQNPIHIVGSSSQLMDFLSGRSLRSDRLEHRSPFLILLDWNMLAVSSAPVLKWIRCRSELHNVLVIVLSGSADPKERRTAFESGANWHIPKSPDFHELIELMLKIRSFWTNHFGHVPGVLAQAQFGRTHPGVTSP